MKKKQFPFKFLKTVDEVPKREGVGRKSALEEFDFFKEVRSFAEAVRTDEVSPYEIKVEINIDDFPALKKEYKNPFQSVLIKTRNLLKDYKLTNKLTVTARGHKIYLVGASNE